jgi:hypothetical protein
VTSDERKFDYAYSYLRRKYVGPKLTSGALAAEGSYIIERLVSGDDFTNVGAPENSSGTLFTASGTTPTAWTKGSVLRLVNLAELRTLADSTFESATDTITLTSSSSEGGQASGVVTFEKVILGQALEKILAEFDPDYTPPPGQGSGFFMQFSPA